MAKDIRTIGIIGAGKLGTVLAQLALKAGYNVYISGSGDREKIALSMQVLAPGAVATTNEMVAHNADVVILALPLGKFRELNPEAFVGKLVIDATNYWWEVDGPRSDIVPDDKSSSEAVQEFLTGARVVKALSHMSYHDLHDYAAPKGSASRKAIAIAGSDTVDVSTVAAVVDKLGFDPLMIGSLSTGRRLEPSGPVFGASENLTKLRELLDYI